MNSAIISAGSNIRPEHYIQNARILLSEHHHIVAESRFVRTEPIGFKEQDPFLNGVFKIETNMTKQSLNKWLKRTEDALDRKRNENKYGPRTIDLDIVVWNNRIVDEDVLRYDFLQKAIREIDPDILA